jgi:hypothetical protein
LWNNQTIFCEEAFGFGISDKQRQAHAISKQTEPCNMFGFDAKPLLEHIMHVDFTLGAVFKKEVGRFDSKNALTPADFLKSKQDAQNSEDTEKENKALWGFGQANSQSEPQSA